MERKFSPLALYVSMKALVSIKSCSNARFCQIQNKLFIDFSKGCEKTICFMYFKFEASLYLALLRKNVMECFYIRNLLLKIRNYVFSVLVNLCANRVISVWSYVLGRVVDLLQIACISSDYFLLTLR